MAKINNTSVYPNIIPTANDFVVLTDVTDHDKTKTAKVTDFQAFFGTTTISKTVTSAQLLSCSSNPVTIIAGVAGHYIVPISAAFKYTYGTSPYAASANLFYIGLGATNPGARWCLAPDIEAVAQTSVYLQNTTAIGANPQYAAPGEDVIFYADSSDPTGGDGTLTIDIMYRLLSN